MKDCGVFAVAASGNFVMHWWVSFSPSMVGKKTTLYVTVTSLLDILQIKIIPGYHNLDFMVAVLVSLSITTVSPDAMDYFTSYSSRMWTITPSACLLDLSRED